MTDWRFFPQLEYHMALGPHLRDMPEESWKIFKQEKRDNMVSGLYLQPITRLLLILVPHGQLVVLDFPMNCEPQRVS